MKEMSMSNIRDAAEHGTPISQETALEILRCERDEIPEIMAAATKVRKRYFGNRFRLCSIINAKSGECGEDCAFCAQSIYHDTGIEVFALVSGEEIATAYEKATELPISHFGVITSGKALNGKDLRMVGDAVKSKKNPLVTWCASLGCLDESQLLLLKEAGVKRFHHNLECAESFFPSICSTHSYAQRIDTVRAVKEVGMEICCGGILGLGESLEQRVEFADILAKERVDSIPMNFLIPIAGTRLESQIPMKPLDMIRSIAMFRLMNPKAEIKVCAGRIHMRDLQSMIFYAGATGMMMGSLLTVAGRDVQQDQQMIEDLEMSDAEFH